MPDLTGLKLVQTTCWGNQAWMHGHQCDNLTYGDGDTPPTSCGYCAADVPSEKWDRVYRTTGDPHTGQSEAPTRGTGSTLPAEQTQPALSDVEDAQAPTEPLPPPCSLWWRDRESCADGDVHHCVLIGGHRIHRCVCSASWSSGFTADADVEAGKPDATEQLFADFTTEWLAAGDDAERTEALEDLLDGWYTAWPDTAVTSPHWPIADRLVQMLGPWNGTTMVDPDDATDDLWLIVAEVLAKGGLDAAMFEDDAREILRRLGLPKVQRKAAMLSGVLLWRDHTAAVLATLLDELDRTTVDSTHELLTAVATAREVLAEDPEQAYGFTGFDATVSHTVTNLRTIHRLRHALATVTDQLAHADTERDTWKSNAEHWENNRNGWHLRALRAEAERDEARRVRDAEQLASRSLRDDTGRLRRRIAALASVEPTQAEYGAAQTAIIDAWPHLAGDAFVDQVAVVAVDAAWKLNGTPRAEDTDPADEVHQLRVSLGHAEYERDTLVRTLGHAWPGLVAMWDHFVKSTGLERLISQLDEAEEADPDQAGEDAPDWTGNLYRRLGKPAPAPELATPPAPAAGTNGCTEGC